MQKNINNKFLPIKINLIIKKFDENYNEKILEIRLRIKQALEIITYKGKYFIDNEGYKVIAQKAYYISKDDIKKSLLVLTQNSIYALERQFKEGFITIPGGHRVGIAGKVVIENGRIKTQKDINSINFRISNEIPGIANKIINNIYDKKIDYIYNTLIISPPLCGKTTLLRDFIRIISSDIGKKIAVVDERSEIAGIYNGIPGNKIGPRTDILDNCPKAKGMIMLIRSMSPEVIAVDEIGKDEDIKAIKEAVYSGVSVLATVHGKDLKSIKVNQKLKEFYLEKIFKRYITLSKRNGVGTIENIYNERGDGLI